jgi:hypothetical protein
MESRENPEGERDVSVPSETRQQGSSTSPRPAILQPEVQSPKQLENPFGALGSGLPDVIRRARAFYERHPTLVKTAGTFLLAAMARRFYRGRRGGWF